MNSCEATGGPIYSALGSDPDVAEIVAMFVDEIPARIEAMEAAFAAGDWEALRRAAHQMKGAAGSYGFGPISPRAGEVETAIRGGADAEAVRHTLDALAELCRQARAGSPN